MTADGPISPDMERFSAHGRGGTADASISKIAEAQHGVVSLAQLIEVGLTGGAVRQRAESGRLHRVHQGVYAVGHPLLSQRGRWMAAVLACGPGAVLSHRSAAALWGLRPSARRRIDVTAPGRRGRSPAGLDAHRHGSLAAADRTTVAGVPCTTVARTLLDLAGVVRYRELRNALVEAEVQRVLDLASAREVISRGRGRRGVARLRLAIEEHDPREERANRGLERRFLRLCRRAELPAPEVNVPLALADRQVVADFLWREARLIVEADGRSSHLTGRAFERDRGRDQQLTVAGWRVIRCTWRQVTEEPERLVAILRELLAAGPRRSPVRG
jgi:very-short-patch-repair endonuclease/predicted transcriptional regulator of viral defense system